MSEHEGHEPQPMGRAGAPGRLRPILSVLGPAVLWAAHLGVCYLFVTLACNTGWGGAGWAVGVATVAFGGGAFGLGALRSEVGPDADTESVSMMFEIGRASGALFGLTIVLTGLVPLFVRLCW
ncbi:MAG: hypothetical protein ACRELV_07040 [Longimicrobiales bacterium]